MPPHSPLQLPFVCITRPPGMVSPPPVTVVPAATANGTDVLVAASAVPRLLAASATRRATAALKTAALVLGVRPGLTVPGRSRRLAAEDAAIDSASALDDGTAGAAGRRLTGQLTAPPGSVVAGGNATGAMGGAGGRFQLLTGNFTWQAAETACRAVGGHLATFDDYRQQLLVETTYIGLVSRCCWFPAADVCTLKPFKARVASPLTAGALHLQGYLFPAHHKTYWTGLYSNTTAGGGRWGWIYPAAAGSTGMLTPSSYSHWGSPVPDYLNLPPEPNNLFPPEQCCAANASEAYWPGDAWGWADAGCTQRMPAMCRLMPPGQFR